MALWLESLVALASSAGRASIERVKTPSIAGLFNLLRVAYAGLGLYCILYSPVLAAVKIGLIRPLVLAGLTGLLAHFVVVGRFCRRIPVSVFFAAAGLFAALAFSQALAFLGGGDPFLMSLLLAVFTGVLPLTILVVWAVSETGEPLALLIRYTAVLGIVQAVLILADWWLPPVREAFSHLVLQPDLLRGSYRAAGFTSMTGDGLSVSQAICAVCVAFLAVDSEKRRVALGWAAGLALILATMIFVGRTGFVLIAFFGGFLFLFHWRRKRILVGALLVMLVFLGGVWLISISVDERLASMFSEAFSSAFEAFIGVGEGDGFRTVSTDDLKTMVLFPESARGWLVGYGFYASVADPDQNYMGTDIGYIRLLLYVGLVGSIFIYCWYAAVAAWAVKNFRQPQNQIFCAGLVACFFVSQLKFSFLLLLAPMGFTLLMFLAAIHGRE